MPLSCKCKKEKIDEESKNSSCGEDCKQLEQNADNGELENLKKELKDTKELLLRTAAEYENFRKRSEREKESIYSDASALAVLSILPLADSFDAAVNSAKTQSEEYQKGIGLLKNQLDTSLKALNVTAFGEVGDDFNPNIHNAISHKDSEDEKQSFISVVYQKGYKMGERIVRHAMVEVTN